MLHCAQYQSFEMRNLVHLIKKCNLSICCLNHCGQRCTCKMLNLVTISLYAHDKTVKWIRLQSIKAKFLIKSKRVLFIGFLQLFLVFLKRSFQVLSMSSGNPFSYHVDRASSMFLRRCVCNTDGQVTRRVTFQLNDSFW